ncbi:MAG: outer membrane protein transport protein [Gammaproteobacteria bacterium]
MPVSNTAWANDLLRNSAGARTMGTGGIVAMADDPLAAMTGNPAYLTSQTETSVQVGLTTVLIDARYSNIVEAGNKADSGPGFVPDLAVVHPLDGSELTLGGAITTQSALKADYRFPDPPGTLGVTYGVQKHKSEYIVLKSAVGAAYNLNDTVSVGGSLGISYNRNRLKAPYIFQSHPVLKGLKVLTNLDTDGLGVNATLGVDYRPSDKFLLSAGYSFKTAFNATGRITGNLGELGLPISPEFKYDAEVDTAVPRSVSLSAAWQATPQLMLGVQLDWIDWSDAFDQLPLHFTNGDNIALNALLGSDAIDDTAPLDWRDQYIFHIGSEYRWSDNVSLRAGYQYGRSPVPAATLTPMTAAITKHAVSLGLGYQSVDYTIDLAYRWSLPNTERAGNSILLGGEFNDSSTRVGTHWFGFSIRF